MRKNFAQCCLGLLMVPVLTFMLIGTVALAVDGPGGYSLSLNETSKELKNGETFTLAATVTANGSVVTNPNITWSSNDNGNAVTLSSTSGSSITVTANKVSADTTVTITATCDYTYVNSSSSSQPGKIETTCTITVKAPPAPTVQEVLSASINSTSYNLTVGETKDMSSEVKVKVQMSDNTEREITSGFSLSAPNNNDFVTIDKSRVTGKKAGSTGNITFTASVPGATGNATVTCEFVVTAAPVTGVTISTPAESSLTMDVGSSKSVTAVTNPPGGTIEWKTEDEDVAYVDQDRKEIIAKGPGVTQIWATCGDLESRKIKVTVNGLKMKEGPFTVTEGDILSWEDVFETYGSASISNLSFRSGNPTVASYVQNKGFQGNSAGVSTFTATFKGTVYEFTLTVLLNEAYTIDLTGDGPYYVGRNLEFSSILDRFKTPNGTLNRVMGLSVSSTSAGTLFYNYQSDDVPNQGVGSSAYYKYPTSSQRGISDLTFVPKAGYSGTATIFYTAVSDGGQNYACKIVLNVDSGGAGASGTVSMTTDYNTAVRFSGSELEQVCRQQTGANLSYVVFSLPAVREGTLYTNYVGEGNYGSPVTSGTRYNKTALNNVWFVPAPGYSGTVTIYYTAQSTVSSSQPYKGQILVTVRPENQTSIGGLAYDVAKGGVAYFDDEDFNSYCQEDLMDYRQTLSFIRFDSLPSASEGVLYYDYRSSTNTGTRADTSTNYYYSTRNPRIDRLAFVPAADFVGTVRLPFTGQTASGVRFAGNVEVNVRGGTGTGDIYYNCAPGRTVNFRTSDFTTLSRRLTGNTINYIRFQGLPNSADGYLYHNSTRITTTGTSYYNSTGSSRIGNLSFRASNSFSGTVDIPFEGTDSRGGIFTGVVTIGTSGSGVSTGNIRYTANAKSAAVFERDDFDSLSWEETREYINNVRFKLPSSSQGTLYRGYRSSSSTGTRITTSNYSVSASALDQVAFVPASGYTGTVYLDFTATALNNGGTFDGTVEIEVGRAPADVTVSYSTRSTTPAHFYGSDFGRRGYTLSSIRFTALPSSSEGYLYYQYSSPTHYGRMASTGTSYRVSGNDLISDLAFVPRAGYTGTVSIPYVGTNSNNSTFEGEVLITVSPTYSSSYFSDMGGYSEAQRAAVDFLYDHNITRGLTTSQYGPEASIRRGDFARMVYQAFELSSTGSAGAFRDVPSSAYYAEAVNALYARGIVSGIGDGYYAPDSTLTRQDAICMVQRAMRAVGWSASDGSASSLYSYSDGGSVSGYAQGAMAFAVQRGYLPTYGGYLNPTQALTRVDMAEIIHRVLTY